LPKYCEAKLETMKTVPIGRMNSENEFIAPVVVAASATWPRCATIHASARPITDCEARDTMMGHANPSRERTFARTRVGDSACTRR